MMIRLASRTRPWASGVELYERLAPALTDLPGFAALRPASALSPSSGTNAAEP
jgi:hypothetical protein